MLLNDFLWLPYLVLKIVAFVQFFCIISLVRIYSKSGHTYKLKYNPSETSENQCRKKKRKIIWFSKIVITNVGKKFLTCTIRQFLKKNHPLYRANASATPKNECPLNSECTTSNVLYKEKIDSNQRNYTEELYKGITATILSELITLKSLKLDLHLQIVKYSFIAVFMPFTG